MFKVEYTCKNLEECVCISCHMHVFLTGFCVVNRRFRQSTFYRYSDLATVAAWQMA